MFILRINGVILSSGYCIPQCIHGVSIVKHFLYIEVETNRFPHIKSRSDNLTVGVLYIPLLKEEG